MLGSDGETALANGAFGPIEGFVRDQVVFGHYRRLGTWSPELLALLLDRFPAGRGTFIDVGANIGLVSIPLANRVPGLVGQAFEPAPGNFALLNRNLARHGLRGRVQTHAVAAYDCHARLPLALSHDNAGDHRLTPEAVSAAGGRPDRVTVTAAPLDALLDVDALPEPVVMKVDTQGAEAHVLAGAPRLLARVSHLVLEYWPLGLARLGRRPRDLRAPLLSAFDRGGLLGQSESRPALEPLSDLLDRLSFFADDDPGFFDLWCARAGARCGPPG